MFISFIKDYYPNAFKFSYNCITFKSVAILAGKDPFAINASNFKDVLNMGHVKIMPRLLANVILVIGLVHYVIVRNAGQVTVNELS